MKSETGVRPAATSMSQRTLPSPAGSEHGPAQGNHGGQAWARLFEHLPLIAAFLVVVAVYSVFLRPGPVFLSDYTVIPQVDPLRLNGDPTASFVAIRNAGYAINPSAFRWPAFVSALPGAALGLVTGNSSYAKLVIPLYSIIGSAGFYVVLHRWLRAKYPLQRTKIVSLAVGAICVGYVVNPATIQSVLKGYTSNLAPLAFLPWFVVAYVWLCDADRFPRMVLRASGVGVIALLGAIYTYAIPTFALVVVAFEIDRWIRHPRQNLWMVAIRVGLVLSFIVLMDLPVLVALFQTGAGQYLAAAGGTANYASTNHGLTLLQILTLTNSTKGNEYIATTYPVWTLVYVALFFMVTFTAALIVIMRKIFRAALMPFILTVGGILLASGPLFPPNTWLINIAPIFPEAWSFFPLVAFGLFLLVSVALLDVLSPENPASLKRQSYGVGRRSFDTTRHAAMTGVAVLVAAVVVSSGLSAAALTSRATPADIPTFDTSAYSWLEAHSSGGRAVIVPPSYSNGYGYNQIGPYGPDDYWAIYPPTPIFIGPSGGSLNGVETELVVALYTGDSNLLYYFLTTLDVQFVVVREDANYTWDVPDYHLARINASYMEENFPLLRLVQSFGPILIYEFSLSAFAVATAHPVVLYCSANTYGEVQALESATPYYEPLVGQGCNTPLPPSLSALSDVPRISTVQTLPPAPSRDHVVDLAQVNLTGTSTIDLASGGYLHLLGEDPSSVFLRANPTSVASFLDNFTSPSQTEADWQFSLGGRNSSTGWVLGNDSLTAMPGAYQPEAYVRSPFNESLLSVQFKVRLAPSAFSAGVVFSSQDYTFRTNSLTFQLIPSYNKIGVVSFRNGTGTQTYIPVAPLALSYNTTYSLNITVVGNVASLCVDGQRIASVSVPKSELPFVGLESTKGDNTSFTNFSVIASRGTPETPVDHYSDPSWKVSESVYGPGPLKLVTGTPTDQVVALGMISNDNSSVEALLSPARLNVSTTGGSAANEDQVDVVVPSSMSVFIAISLLNDGLWTAQGGSSVSTANFFEISFTGSGEVHLRHSPAYSYAVIASAAVLVVAVTLVTATALLSLRPDQGKRRTDDHMAEGSTHPTDTASKDTTPDRAGPAD